MKKVLSISIFLIALLFSACQKNISEDQKLIIEIDTLISQKSFDEALVKCETILEKYPTSPYVMRATLEIAKFYHSRAISGLEEKEQLGKAVQQYLKVYNSFPDSSETPKALFYAGFILANELQMYDSAKTIYNKFLKVYPQNELTQHIKHEIENIGLTPDQILKNKKQN